MELIRGLDQLKPHHQPSVASIGNYDGVHLGHQHVIKTLLTKCQELEAPSMVITFEPLAKEFFAPESVTRLSSIEDRANRLFELGVDRVLVIEFDADFASYTPNGFIQDVLVQGLGVKYLCVGDDFRFGKNREGDFSMLLEAGALFGFDVMAHDTFELDGNRVSSGRVRDALSQNDFDLAARLLGRRFAISGEVTKGRQLGRTIDFPTANIPLPGIKAPIAGVFAVIATHTEYGTLNGVANVGNRPTVNGQENRLEVHLFDFDADLYGQQLQVEFHSKIRDEIKFDSFDLLTQQIKLDAAKAKAVLGI